MTLDYTKLIKKLSPDPNREAQGLTLRTAVVDSVNADGSANVILSGGLVENVGTLASAPVMAGLVVQLLTTRGSMLVLGPVSGKQTLIKSADQNSPTSSTALVDATDLVFTGQAGATYMVEALLAYDGPTGGDIKVAWSVPSGSSMARYIDAPQIGATSNENTAISMIRRSAATGQAAGATGGAANGFTTWREKAILRMGDTGPVQLQFGQNSSNVTATVLRGDSLVIAERIG